MDKQTKHFATIPHMCVVTLEIPFMNFTVAATATVFEFMSTVDNELRRLLAPDKL